MDIFRKCEQFTRARQARIENVYPYYTSFGRRESSEVEFGRRKLVIMGSNDYLGLTTDPRVREASCTGMKQYGTSFAGSRLLNGTSELHYELETRLAKFTGKEAAVVFASGYHANVGVISCLIGRNDTLLADKEAHASIVDGCRLSFGQLRRFPHNDLTIFKRRLDAIEENAGVLVAVDGVYSMLGDLAPLPEIVKACQQKGAGILVDDAHGFGVLAQGHGTVAHFGLVQEIDLIVGTFSKALASTGGFVAGSERVVDYVKHHARSLVFSDSLPAGNLAAALTALDIIEREPDRNRQLWSNVAKLRNGLKQLGYNVGSDASHIIPVVLGDEQLVLLAWKLCFEAGVYVNAIIPPAVPPGCSLIRLSCSAVHTDKHLDFVLNILEDVGKRLNLTSRVVETDSV
jgi:8-amino-7-oxononanoate synthase